MTVRKEYRVNGRDNYVVDFVQTNGTVEMWVRLHPPDSFQKSASITHLFSNGKICVSTGREPKSLPAAEKIVRSWVETYSKYVRTGKFE